MDYFIVITTVLSILICLSNADKKCENNEVCMDLDIDEEEQCVKDILETTDHTNMKRCNGGNGVCCKYPPPKSVSDRKCWEWQEINGFCKNIPLIAHGYEAQPHSLPFMALIKFTAPKLEKPIVCAGSLIDIQWVLTAGHCFDDMRNIKNLTFTVYLGAHNFTDSGIAFNGTYIVHPGYGNNDTLADLALIKLDREADITDKVKPACLVYNSSIITEYFAAGWGQTETHDSARFLLRTNLTEKPEFNKCKLETISPDREKNICLKPMKKLGDVCAGDSGGPIFNTYPGLSNCNYEIVAIVAEGNSCAVVQGSFSLHTRMDYYRNWIESRVWPNEIEEYRRNYIFWQTKFQIYNLE